MKAGSRRPTWSHAKTPEELHVLYEAMYEFEVVEWFMLDWNVGKYRGAFRLYWKGKL